MEIATIKTAVNGTDILELRLEISIMRIYNDKNNKEKKNRDFTKFSAPGRFPLLARFTASSKLFNCKNGSVDKQEIYFSAIFKKEQSLHTYLATDKRDNCCFIDRGK